MIGVLRKLFGPKLRADFGVKWNDAWNEIHSGIVYRIDKETSEGVRIRGSHNEAYKHMETGAIQVIERKDAWTEWYEHRDKVDWPEYVKRTESNGHTWHDPERDGMPRLRGEILSNSPRSLWKRVDDVDLPRHAR